jgi:hypothetical protein
MRLFDAAVLLARCSALWLMGAKPLGIKLHEPLCLALGEAILYCASVCEAVSDATPLITPRSILWLARAGALGFSFQVCALRVGTPCCIGC